MTRRVALAYGGGAAALTVLALASLAIGSRATPVLDVLRALLAFDPGNDLHLIVRELRVPRCEPLRGRTAQPRFCRL